MKYQTQNGWDREMMLAWVEMHFNGRSASGKCLYRGPRETKCAVGMFIPDELYDLKMDAAGCGGSRANQIIPLFKLEDQMPLSTDGMQDFQRVHDLGDEDGVLDDMIKWIENNVYDRVSGVDGGHCEQFSPKE